MASVCREKWLCGFGVALAFGVAPAHAQPKDVVVQIEKAQRAFALGAPAPESPRPQSTALPRKGGYWQHFQRGFIYWSAKVGVHVVRPHIFAAWAKDGREKGHLGYPTTHERPCAKPQPRDVFQVFEGGRIHYDSKLRRAEVLPNPTRFGDGGVCERQSFLPTREEVRGLKPGEMQRSPLSPAHRDLLKTSGCVLRQAWMLGDLRERYVSHLVARLPTVRGNADAAQLASGAWAKLRKDLFYTLKKDRVEPDSADEKCLRALVLEQAKLSLRRFVEPPSQDENWGFEKGLAGWTAEGSAFAAQPTFGINVGVDRLRRLPLGGDYWAGFHHVGHKGEKWIGTYERRPNEATLQGTTQGERPTGTLTSKSFLIHRRFLHFLIGGGFDPARLRVSLLVKVEAGDTAPTTGGDRAPIAFAADVAPIARERGGDGRVRIGDGDYTVAATATGHGSDVMRREVWDTANLRGRTVRIRIEDASAQGHINVDDFQFTDRDPTLEFLRVAPAPKGGQAKAHFIDKDLPVWGIADLHVHVNAHQSMGGLQGVRTLWGVPGGRYEDYRRNPRLIFEDIPRCDGYNHRGIVPMADRFQGFLGAGLIGALTGRSPSQANIDEVLQLFLHEKGEPGVKRADPFKDGMHQQHHITAIRRAYEGGLRLMTVHAVHSEFMELIAGVVRRSGNRHFVQLTPEMDLVRAGVCATQQLARLNSDWMEIAYTPDDARRIIAQDKLALVLGIELPDAGNLVPRAATPDVEVEELYRLGIRQIILIHGANNKNGGAAIFQDVYDWFNDLMWTGRDAQNRVSRTHRDVTRQRGTFLVPAEGGCTARASPVRGRRGECVGYTLGQMGLRPVVTKISEIGMDIFPLVLGAGIAATAAASPLFAIPIVGQIAAVGVAIASAAVTILYAVLMATEPANTPVGIVSPPADLVGRKIREGVFGAPLNFNRLEGHVNSQGLSSWGRRYVQAMMARGMVVDFAHSSDASARHVFEEAFRNAARQHGTACTFTFTPADVWGRLARAPDRCFDAAYPLVYGHAQFRAQGIQRYTDKLDGRGTGRATTSKAFLPREFEISDSQLEVMRRLGGVVGAFMGQELVDPPHDQQRIAVRNDCGGSTKSFAWGFAYGSQKLGRKGVALGSDAVFHDMFPPRFGREACSTYKAGGNPDIERALNSDMFDMAAQRDAVRYAGMTQSYPTRAHPPLQPYRQANIAYDYNLEGWANYGVLPDFLQDARNVGMTAGDLAPVFRSASDYVDAWQKAHRVSGCARLGGRCAAWTGPRSIDCRAACRGTCPDDPRRGAPPPAPEYRVSGILTNDRNQDSIDGRCLAAQLPAANAGSPQDQCQRAVGYCGFDRSCHHRANVCSGVMGARVWPRCEDDPDRPLIGDAMHGPEIRLGACYAARGLRCDTASFMHDEGATALGRRTCEEVTRAMGAQCRRQNLAPGARWGRIEDKGCRGPKRLFAARIENTGSADWRIACQNTSATIAGRRIDTPTRCADTFLGIGGTWGEWEVDDARCRAAFVPPRWEPLRREHCEGTMRKYSAKILHTGSMRFENACAQTPATVSGVFFRTPTRCETSVLGSWGVFLVRDPECMRGPQPYWDPLEDKGCQGGQRLYSAKIRQTGGLRWEDACTGTPQTIDGRRYERPTRCQTFVTGTWGEWLVDDARCAGGRTPPYWGTFDDNGCRGEKRQMAAKILNTGALRWEDACAATPTTVRGQRFATPTRCETHVTGTWGIFLIDDAACRAAHLAAGRPSWDPFRDEGCRGQKRLYTSKIRNTGTMRWEDACAQTTATVAGTFFRTPTRCDVNVLGAWGHFEVDDARCRAAVVVRPPRWEPFRREHCEGPLRKYSAKILDTGSMRWEDACRATPATVAGTFFRTPSRCETSVLGTWGVFLVADPTCNARFRAPRWDNFEDKGCRGTRRLYSAKILDTGSMRWEDACWSTPASIGPQYFPRPARCLTFITGTWGEWDVDDPRCR